MAGWIFHLSFIHLNPHIKFKEKEIVTHKTNKTIKIPKNKLIKTQFSNLKNNVERIFQNVISTRNWTWFFSITTRCPSPSGSVDSTSTNTWRMLDQYLLCLFVKTIKKDSCLRGLYSSSQSRWSFFVVTFEKRGGRDYLLNTISSTVREKKEEKIKDTLKT